MRQEEFAKEAKAAVNEVMTTMLGLEVEAGEAVSEQEAPGPTNGVVALVGLAGPWVGTGSLSCSAEMASKLSSAFLMTEYESVNEDVLDAMAELANMIIGNFKTALEEELGPMGLSIPTVIYGRNFTTRALTKKDWVMVPFTCSHGVFEVHICLVPGSDKPKRPVRPGYSELHSASS